ncbi:Carbohydrate esterase family 16 protein [Mycena indigotica]|uniref:Carbohydrate esterase family 16 protein n=1 Tax=Mycena indigotica TaxID=2126181 RepID=A0A8H6W940_9AGAR|nr:Carbohydrate esterase family 16 protein [Mycena indigotica]KAF7306213.1 Carbohydrate esterase family 16 protein [Mycena indigotica]
MARGVAVTVLLKGLIGAELVSAAAAHVNGRSLPEPVYWFSFGDSYTQTGFNITTGPLPSRDRPLGNPTYPGATATPGPNWIDVATVEYNHSLVLTYNLAFSGATISRDLVLPYADFVQTLPDQIAQLKTWDAGQDRRRWNSENALFSIWLGINDIDLSWATDVDHPRSFNEAVDCTILYACSNSRCPFLHHLYLPLSDFGARNLLFINVPPLQRAPGMNDASHSAANRTFEAKIIQNYNAQLSAAAHHFAASNRGVSIWEYDAHAAFNRVLDNPAGYGFNDTSGDDGKAGQFWYNWLHPVSAAQVVVGREIGQLLRGTAW